MELIFLGKGSAFNPEFGNTSAYFIENNELFLIDCGESVFSSLIQNNILNDINLMITHTHSDHIGSLVLYSYYEINRPLNIIIPSRAKHLISIKDILCAFGCTDNMVNFISEEKYDNLYEAFKNVRYAETKHSKNINCYSLLFDTDNGIIYYSGDTCETDTIKTLINSGNTIDKMFVDTISNDFDGNPHLYIETLEEIIPNDHKNKAYCMHLNNSGCNRIEKK